MLNSKKIELFRRYKGNLDNWSRGPSKRERAVLSDSEWYLISNIAQDLFIIEGGLCSEQYKNTFEEKLKREGVDQEMRSQLVEIMRSGKF
ncbi:hypothetical protein GCM10028810_04250 [Spirosoma litoris]